MADSSLIAIAPSRLARKKLAAPLLVLAMALAALGNGLMFAFIPVRLSQSGFGPAWAGLILTGMAAGGVLGCLMTGWLIRRLGHSLAFAAMAGLILLSNLAIALGVEPFL